MLQMQAEDGFIPEEIFWGPRTAAEDAELLLTYSNIFHTDITQMPVLPFSLRAIYQASGSRAILKEFVYPLINYFKWWRNTRDKGDGLVVIIHNWESGLDASPAYDPAFHTYVTDVNQTSLYWLYPKFIEVVETYKFLYKWNVTEILARETAPERPSKIETWWVVKDIGVNSVYAAGWDVLGDLVLELGDVETAKFCHDQARITSRAIINKMWNKDLGHFQTMFIDRDGVEKYSVANTVQNLFPLLLRDLPADKTAFLVSQIKDTRKFGAPFSIPTVAMDDPQFDPSFDADLMWRGPVWGFTNWFVLEGLGVHKQLDLQEAVLSKWVALAEKSGISEMYNPLTGEPYGPEGLGMSTLVCDWIYRYGWDKL
jgi:hypothetical protein